MDGPAGAWSLASLLAGSIDAIAGLTANRGVPAAQLLPLCLTAPVVLDSLLLAPLAIVAGVALKRGARIGPRSAGSAGPPDSEGPGGSPGPSGPAGYPFAATLAVLVAGVAGAAGYFAAESVVGSVVDGLDGARRGAWTGAARPAAALVAAAAGARWAWSWATAVSDAGRRRLCSAASTLQVLAAIGLLGLVKAEGRGVLIGLVRPGSFTGRPADAAAVDLPRPGPPAGAAVPAPAVGPEPAGTLPEPALAEPRHLLLITVDTLRADHLDPGTMPAAARFAAGGWRFDAAFSASPWTLPSIAALLTGSPAAAHGAGLPTGPSPLDRSALPDDRVTLAERLADVGFDTEAIVTNPYLGLSYGLGAGFARFENVTLESEAVLSLRGTLGGALILRGMPGLAVSDRGSAVTARAARALARRDPARRYFLWLHYVDPHAPYAGTTRSFRTDLLEGGEETEAPGAPPRMARLRAGEVRLDAVGRRSLRAAYRRAVADVDREIGAVLALIDAHRLADETLVVLTADHGEEFWEHGGVEHGHSLHDELIRVPLAVRCPTCGIPPSRVATPVGLDRVAATVLDLLGVAPDPALQPGLGDELRGGPSPRPGRGVLSENLLFAEDRIALRTARHTYVRWASGKEEVFDRRSDPGELRDLSARRGLVARLRRAADLQRSEAAPPPPHRRAFGAGAAGGSPGAPRAAIPGDPVRRALRALGYVE